MVGYLLVLLRQEPTRISFLYLELRHSLYPPSALLAWPRQVHRAGSREAAACTGWKVRPQRTLPTCCPLGSRAAPSRCIHARRARVWGPGATRTAAAQQELHSERQAAPAAVRHKNRTRSPVPVGRPSLCPRTDFAAPASARSSGAAASSSPPQHTARTRPPEAPHTCAAIARALHPAPT